MCDFFAVTMIVYLKMVRVRFSIEILASQIMANTLPELRRILDTTLFNAKHCKQR